MLSAHIVLDFANMMQVGCYIWMDENIFMFIRWKKLPHTSVAVKLVEGSFQEMTVENWFARLTQIWYQVPVTWYGASCTVNGKSLFLDNWLVHLEQ